MKVSVDGVARAVLPAVFSVLAGCLDGVPSTAAQADDKARTAGRDETPVVVVPYGSGYLATQVISFTNDAAGAERAAVTLATSVGDVVAVPGASGYRIDVVLEGSGETEEQARRALATMAVGHTDRLRNGTLELGTRVTFAEYQPPHGGGVVELGSVRSASVHALLPAQLSYALNQATDIGNASATGLSGTAAILRTNIGDVSLDGTWRRVEGVTDVGSAHVALAAQGDADVLVASDIGNAEVALLGPVGGGFDLVGETQIGGVTILVHGTQPVGTPSPTKAHYRTPGFEGLSPQVRVQGYSGIGNVFIHD